MPHTTNQFADLLDAWTKRSTKNDPLDPLPRSRRGVADSATGWPTNQSWSVSVKSEMWSISSLMAATDAADLSTTTTSVESLKTIVSWQPSETWNTSPAQRTLNSFFHHTPRREPGPSGPGGMRAFLMLLKG